MSILNIAITIRVLIILLGALSLAMIIYYLFRIDYKDLSWKKNKDAYTSIFSAFSTLFLMLLLIFKHIFGFNIP